MDMRFAVLIDADNVSEKYVSVIMDEVANAGVATYKRIYGDWTSSRLASWKGCLLDNSIIPMQQYSYTTGKNATDSAMIIDAMDILYSGTVDGFVIVSSDSDFTRLVARLRESGMVVIGMGEQKTPKPFISACNQFKYLDLLFDERQAAEEVEEAEEDGEDRPGEMSKATKRRMLKVIRSAVKSIADGFSDDDGWVILAQVGDQLGKRLPDFDVRNFGYARLHPFLKSLNLYEFKEQMGKSGTRQIYLRMRGGNQRG